VELARFSGIEKGEISAGLRSGRFLCLEAPGCLFPIREISEVAEEEYSIELLVRSETES
jgi:hypothetical protein